MGTDTGKENHVVVKVLMVGQLCFSSLLGVFYRRVEV
jgi:hypothetical protein